MRVLIWATTFGADLWALTQALEARAISVRVAMPEPRAFLAQAVAHLGPLGARPVATTLARSLFGSPCFRPDVTVLDETPPWRAPSLRGLVLWRLAGAPAAPGATLWRRLAWAFEDPRRPTQRLRWACHGPMDLLRHTASGGVHPDNCVTVGVPSHDHLRAPFDKARARAFYPFMLAGRPTVLFVSTSEDAAPLARWGDAEDLLDRLLDHLGRRGANVILRLPSRAALSPAGLARARAHRRRHAHLLLKFDDTHPDDLVDMQVSDLLLTDAAPAAVRFLATGRPIIHLDPPGRPTSDRLGALGRGSARADVSVGLRAWLEGADGPRRGPTPRGGELMPGCRAHDLRGLLRHLDEGLSAPEARREDARAFLDRHLLGADGRACDRLAATLATLCRA
jgi:hypothetical protein